MILSPDNIIIEKKYDIIRFSVAQKNQGDDEIGLDNNEKAETLIKKNMNNMQMKNFYFSSSGEPPR